MEDNYTIDEFKKIIYNYFNDVTIDDTTIQKLYDFFTQNGYTYSACNIALRGAKHKSNLVYGNNIDFSNKKYFNQLLDELLSKQNLSVYRRISVIYEIFNRDSADDKSPKKMEIVKKFLATITNTLDGTDKDIYSFFNSSFNLLENFAFLYYELSKNIHTTNTSFIKNGHGFLNVIDEIMYSKINFFANNIEKFNDQQMEKFSDILYELKNSKDNDENFTDDEIATLLIHTPHILLTSSHDKIKSLRDILNNYFKNICENFQIQDNNLPKFSTKEVILNSGSILGKLSSNVDFTTDLLTGKTLQNILEQDFLNNEGQLYNKSDSQKYVLYKLLPNLKLEGSDFDFNYKVIKRNTSILSTITPSSLYNILDGLAFAVGEGVGLPNFYNFRQRIYTLKKYGVNFEEIITKDNLIPLFQHFSISSMTANGRKIYSIGDNIIKNVNFLSQFLPLNEISKIVQHNILLLTQQPDKIISNFTTIAKGSQNIDEFIGYINNFVNNDFKIDSTINNTGYAVKTKAPKPLTTVNKNKVKVDFKRDDIQLSNIIINKDFLLGIGLSQEIIDNENLSDDIQKFDLTDTQDANQNEIDQIITAIDNNDFKEIPSLTTYKDNIHSNIKNILQFIIKTDIENCDKLIQKISATFNTASDFIQELNSLKDNKDVFELLSKSRDNLQTLITKIENKKINQLSNSIEDLLAETEILKQEKCYVEDEINENEIAKYLIEEKTVHLNNLIILLENEADPNTKKSLREQISNLKAEIKELKDNIKLPLLEILDRNNYRDLNNKIDSNLNELVKCQMDLDKFTETKEKLESLLKIFNRITESVEDNESSY